MDTIAPTFYQRADVISVPKSTSDQTGTVTLPNAWVDSLTIFWPPGGVGLVGVRIVYNGVQIVPWDATTKWIFGHDERFAIPIDMYMPAPIGIHTRNSDKVAHTVITTIQWRDYNASVRVAPPAPIPVVVG